MPECLLKLQKEAQKSDWVEAKDHSGKIYYFNKKLQKSVWTKPPVYQPLPTTENTEGTSQPVVKLSINLSSKIDANAEEKMQQEDPKTKKLSEEDAKQIFFKLLKDHNITSSWKWDKIHLLLSEDERYKVIPRVKHKKIALQEYYDSIKRNERNLHRQKLDNAKKEYMEMLSELT